MNGDPIRARQVANQLALRDAIGKYGVSKVFTFHRTVESAASFVADGNEGVRVHLPEFGAFHVNGTMPTAHREGKMRDFRAAMAWLNIESLNDLLEIMHVNGRLMPGHQPMRVSPETRALVRAIWRPAAARKG